MSNECKHLKEYDKGRYVAQCVITNNTCTAAIDSNGKSRNYMANPASYCPAYNLEGKLATSLQELHLENQRTELKTMLGQYG